MPTDDVVHVYAIQRESSPRRNNGAWEATHSECVAVVSSQMAAESIINQSPSLLLDEFPGAPPGPSVYQIRPIPMTDSRDSRQTSSQIHVVCEADSGVATHHQDAVAPGAIPDDKQRTGEPLFACVSVNTANTLIEQLNYEHRTLQLRGGRFHIHQNRRKSPWAWLPSPGHSENDIRIELLSSMSPQEFEAEVSQMQEGICGFREPFFGWQTHRQQKAIRRLEEFLRRKDLAEYGAPRTYTLHDLETWSGPAQPGQLQTSDLIAAASSDSVTGKQWTKLANEKKPDPAEIMEQLARDTEETAEETFFLDETARHLWRLCDRIVLFDVKTMPFESCNGM
ncbi:MAG: hypothetical protein R3C49_00350 [Planctomycetaceae bacterium]